MPDVTKKKVRPTPKSSLDSEDEIELIFSSGTDGEDDNYSAWEPDTRLSCHECGDAFEMTSTSTDNTTAEDLKCVLKYGLRWHCPSCLKAPHEDTLIKRIDSQTDLLQIVKNLQQRVAKLESIPQKLENYTDDQFKT